MLRPNWYFWQVWVPFIGAFLSGIALVMTGYIQLNAWMILCSWFLIGPVGIGVGFHRLFSHRQFETYKPIEYLLALLGTLAAYGPLLFWASQHAYHHNVSDTNDDPSSPRHGSFTSFFWWRMDQANLAKVSIKNKPVLRILKDRPLLWLSNHFKLIFYTTALTLLLIDVGWLINLLLIPVFIEHLRIDLINYLAHVKLPFSYRAYETKDDSQNNVLLGLLTLGFGWHNTHHAKPGLLSLHQRWWEIDIEGAIAKLLKKP